MLICVLKDACPKTKTENERFFYSIFKIVINYNYKGPT